MPYGIPVTATVLATVPVEVKATTSFAAYSATQRLPSAPAVAPIGSETVDVVGYSTIPEVSDNNHRVSRRPISRWTLARLGAVGQTANGATARGKTSNAWDTPPWKMNRTGV